MPTKGSSPTTQASCPGGITPTSPGPNSALDPSSIRTASRPEMTYVRWRTWQLSVPTLGLTDSDQRHPGSKGVRIAWTSPKSTASTLPLAMGRVSSGALKLFLTILAIWHLQFDED